MTPAAYRQRYQRVTTRVRVFQISGIALLTLGFLNSLFLRTIALHVDMLFLLAGVGQLWFSFRLWNRFRRRYRLAA